MDFTKENITTIATFLYVIVAPILVKYFNFSVDESTFIGIVGFIIAFVSAKHPNTFLSDEDIIESDVDDGGVDDGC